MGQVRRPGPGERGAALLVVVLVVVLLTAIGVFAVHVTGLSQLASGYSRRAASAFYVAEFATNALASDISGNPASYEQEMDKGGDCRQIAATIRAGVPSGRVLPCRPEDTSSLEARLPGAVTGDAEGGTFGLLSRDGRVQASIRTEMTEHISAAELKAGEDVSKKLSAATLTVTGRLLPVTTSAVCSPDTVRASQHVSLRTYLVYMVPGAG